MKRFVEGEDRTQGALLPEFLDDYVAADNPVRVIDVFVDELDLHALGFVGVVPEATGRPAYHPATLLKVYLYGYLNRVQSSRRLERETQRNIELMWLTGRLMPDFKTIADFRRDNGAAIRSASAQFVILCRQFNLFTRAVVALDGSRFKAVNNAVIETRCANCLSSLIMSCAISASAAATSKISCASRVRARRMRDRDGCPAKAGDRLRTKHPREVRPARSEVRRRHRISPCGRVTDCTARRAASAASL